MKIISLSATLAFTLIFGYGPVHAHVEKGMPDSIAEMEYRILLEFKPGDVESRIKLGMVLLNQNKFKEADKEFHKALKSSPESQQAHIGLAILHLKQNRTDRALEFIKEALIIDPERGEVYLHYGKILQSASRNKEALQMYKLGLGKLDPSPESEDHHHRVKIDQAIQEIEVGIKQSASIN